MQEDKMAVQQFLDNNSETSFTFCCNINKFLRSDFTGRVQMQNDRSKFIIVNLYRIESVIESSICIQSRELREQQCKKL